MMEIITLLPDFSNNMIQDIKINRIEDLVSRKMLWIELLETPLTQMVLKTLALSV